MLVVVCFVFCLLCVAVLCLLATNYYSNIIFLANQLVEINRDI